jgi:cardiolipin synthase A/B
MRFKLLVDSDEFWAHLREDLSASKHTICIQTFSLEGDRVGTALSNQILGLTSVTTKILVDSFGKWVINDKYVFMPPHLLNPDLRREYASTTELIEGFLQHGIQVRFTNPVGFLFTKFIPRNHKKLIVIDDKISYVGGINFTEHNFSWHDLMLRIEDRDIAEALSRDFLSTWDNRNVSNSKRFKDIQIHTLDGYSNARVLNEILKLIEGAQNQIFIESPYLSFPFSDSLKIARDRGVPVTVIAPAANNWAIIKEYLIGEAAKYDFELRLYSKGMTHLKAILIDDQYLVLGSSNFDYLSYKLHQEIVIVITDRDVISSFVDRVIHEDLKNSRVLRDEVNFARRHILNFVLKVLARLIAQLGSIFREHAHHHNQETL